MTHAWVSEIEDINDDSILHLGYVCEVCEKGFTVTVPRELLYPTRIKRRMTHWDLEEEARVALGQGLCTDCFADRLADPTFVPF